MKDKNVERIIALSNELRWQIGDDFHDNLAEGIYADASEIVNTTVQKILKFDGSFFIDKNDKL